MCRLSFDGLTRISQTGGFLISQAYLCVLLGMAAVLFGLQQGFISTGLPTPSFGCSACALGGKSPNTCQVVKPTAQESHASLLSIMCRGWMECAHGNRSCCIMMSCFELCLSTEQHLVGAVMELQEQTQPDRTWMCVRYCWLWGESCWLRRIF